MNRKDWLPPYTPDERRRELAMRSLILQYLAQRVLNQRKTLQEQARQPLKKYDRCFFPLRP